MLTYFAIYTAATIAGSLRSAWDFRAFPAADPPEIWQKFGKRSQPDTARHSATKTGWERGWGASPDPPTLNLNLSPSGDLGGQIFGNYLATVHTNALNCRAFHGIAGAATK